MALGPIGIACTAAVNTLSSSTTHQASSSAATCCTNCTTMRPVGSRMHCMHDMQCRGLGAHSRLHSSVFHLQNASYHQLCARLPQSNCTSATQPKPPAGLAARSAANHIEAQDSAVGGTPSATSTAAAEAEAPAAAIEQAVKRSSPSGSHRANSTSEAAAAAGDTHITGDGPAAVAPEIVLQPIRDSGRVALSGPLGQWNDVAVDRGYFTQQQQQRKSWRQQQQQQWKRGQQQQQRKGQGQEGQKHKRQGGSSASKSNSDPAKYARGLTVRISRQDSVIDLLSLVNSTSLRVHLNMIHLSTICRVLVMLQQKQQKQQQQQQQLAHLDCTSELLQLVEQRLVVLLQAGMEAAPAQAQGPAASSNSSSMLDSRSLATIAYCWARLGCNPQLHTLSLLLTAFLRCYRAEQQQQQQALQQHQQQQLDSESSSSSSSSSSNDSSQSQGSPMALSNLCWGLCRLGYTCSRVYNPLSKRNESNANKFGHTLHSSSSSSAVGSSGASIFLEQQQQYWSQLAELVLEGAVTASARDLSSICYAFAAGGYTDVVLWSRLAPCLIAHADDFTPQDWSQLLWAYATVDIRHEGLFAAATPAVCQTIHGFTPQGLTNVLWAYTTTHGRVPATLLEAASAELLDRSGALSSFGPLNLSMLAWVFAKCSTINALVAAAISRAALQTLPSFMAPDLCRLLGSLALLRSVDGELLNAAEPRLLSMLEQPRGDTNIQVVTQGVWAFAASNHPGASRLIEPLINLAGKHVGVLVRSGHATSRLLDGLVLLRYRADSFVQLLAHKLLGVVPATAAAAAGDATAVVAEAAAAAVLVADAVLPEADTAAAARASNRLKNWTSSHLARTAAALARLGYTQQHQLLQLLIWQFSARLPQVTKTASGKDSIHGGSSNAWKKQQQQQVHVRGPLVRQSILLLWSCAVLDLQQPMQSIQKLLRLLKHAQAADCQVSVPSLAQLVQFHMWLETLGPAGKPLIAQLPQAWLKQGLYYWQQELVPAVTCSPMHNNVMSTLAAMKLPAVCEGVTPDGMFSVDVIVNFKGREVALEVMGDEHYSSNIILLPQPPQQQQHQQRQRSKLCKPGLQQQHHKDTGTERRHVLLGPELLRLRLLMARGFAVATVSSFEWERVKTQAAASALLKQCLREAVTACEQREQRGGKGKPAGSHSKRTAKQHKQTSEQEQQDSMQEDSFNIQEQMSEGNLIAQQVARLAQQQGRSKHTRRGLLRAERYKQRRQDLYQEGVQLLLMAAPWSAARKDKRKEHVSQGSSSTPSSVASSPDEWGVDSGMVAIVQHEPKELSLDEDFNISLDIEDLLARQERDPDAGQI